MKHLYKVSIRRRTDNMVDHFVVFAENEVDALFSVKTVSYQDVVEDERVERVEECAIDSDIFLIATTTTEKKSSNRD